MWANEQAASRAKIEERFVAGSGGQAVIVVSVDETRPQVGRLMHHPNAAGAGERRERMVGLCAIGEFARGRGS